MPSDIQSILKIEIPVIVRIASRVMVVDEVINITLGSIIELPKNSDDELEILVNNKPIGLGRAVKVGENFGIRVSAIGDMTSRVRAMGGEGEVTKDEAEAMADAILAEYGA